VHITAWSKMRLMRGSRICLSIACLSDDVQDKASRRSKVVVITPQVMRFAWMLPKNPCTAHANGHANAGEALLFIFSINSLLVYPVLAII
jgi:hypothetical protein